MVVAVIGASGHIGNNICRALLQKGYKVRALIHENAASLEKLDLERVPGDILDLNSLRKFCSNVDVVIHAAGKISIDGDPDGSVHSVNVIGTKNVVETCLTSNVHRLVFVSSIHALKQDPTASLDESREFVESEGFLHDVSKSEAEKEVMKGLAQGLDAVILTPTAVIGPFDFKPSLLGQGLIALYNRKMPALIAGGFDFVDVRDVAKAVIIAMEKGKPGERFLLSGMWRTVRELAEIVEETTGKSAPKFTSPMWLAKMGVPLAKAYSKLTNSPMLYTHETLDVLRRCNRNICSLKAQRELEFYPRPLAETIKDSFAWYEQTGALLH